MPATDQIQQQEGGVLTDQLLALLRTALVNPLFASLSLAPNAGLTAHAGGTQAAAVALTYGINQITTVTTAADSVVLPPAVAGKIAVVINAAAANGADVYPASATQGGVTGGDQINALGVNVALLLAANKTILFFCSVAGTWNSILTA
jgi:hypothetical protein